MRQVRGLSPNDLLLFLPLTVLEAGSHYDPVPLSQSVVATTQAPVITFWRGLSEDALGGYLADPALLGREAIRAYTAYNNTGQFPVEYKTSAWRFNYAQLKRFNLSLDALPEGSLIIGQPAPVISKQAWGLIALGSVLGLLGTLGAWYWGAYHRRLHLQLEKKDAELVEALNVSLAHAEELRASQEQIQLAVDMAALDIVQIDFDAEQISVDGSDSWISLKEWGRNSGISDEHLNAILRLSGTPYVPIEVDAVRTSGSRTKEQRFRVMVSEPVAYSRTHIQYAMLQDISAWKQIRTRAASAEDDRRRVSLSLAGVRKDLNSLLAERDRLAEALHHAQKDALTDLLTRRSWAEFAAIEVDQLLSMDGRQSALLFLDLDHFKSINDTYGHNIGDQALAHFAAIAGEGLRDRDLLGRWGGEEFILILPATNEEQALVVAERIRETLYNSPLRVEGALVKMSVSIGVAAYHKQYPTLEAWVDAADKAAYFAKASGRNTVRKASVSK